jgi:glycosyltransferase involved in cell wall biosynthesis
LDVALKHGGDRYSLRQAGVLESEAQATLGDIRAAELAVSSALVSDQHEDLFLSQANLEVSESARVERVNDALRLHDLARISSTSNDSTEWPLLDRLSAEPIRRAPDSVKISVIVPVYNAQDTIATALDSILSQTWGNLEVLVADDCSIDDTVNIVERYVDSDSRVHLIRSEANNGVYDARNRALRIATGALVTCHDADDWSHPEKVERQAVHLLKNPAIIANTSQQARTTSDLRFPRKGRHVFHVFSNISSIMFHRYPMMDLIGYWDRVRFGADGEFKQRVKEVFGSESVVDLKTGPLSFTRQSEGSLSKREAFGFPGSFSGARKEYRESFNRFHSMATNLRYELVPEVRPFPVPEPMRPSREEKLEGRRHFDVIHVSDFRLPGGTTSTNAEEIKIQKHMGLRTGLIQMCRYDLEPSRAADDKVRELIDGDQVQMLVHGEKVSCDTLIIRHPPVVQEWQQFVPDVEAKDIHFVVNQTPKREYGENGKVVYTLRECKEHLQHYFGRLGLWHPSGTLVRQALHHHHSSEIEDIELAEQNWTTVLNVEEWKRQAHPIPGARTKIGRHSGDSFIKWPADRNELLSAYPNSDDCEIHVLGGAERPKQVLGELPGNWYVWEFGEMHPKDFLSTLDVFVYYTHADMVEAFGRVIIEAMAVGVPVILPYDYQNVFEEAAIYVELEGVKMEIDKLMADRDYYDSQVKIARSYVDRYFGYTRHAERIGKQVS